MRVTSLGYKTDLFFPAFDGEIIDRGNYLVIRTPANPAFFWGNFLLFPAPPAQDDISLWRRLFADEIAPAAPSKCPVMDFVEVTSGMSLPNTVLRARASPISLS